MPVKAQDIFTPGAFPEYTYVERSQQGLETTLRDALSTPGQIVSLSGPSKSGKTVLVERVVGKELLIPISGASIRQPEDVWTRVFEWMNLPSSISSTQKSSTDKGLDITTSGSVGIPLVAAGQMGVAGHLKSTIEETTSTVRQRQGLAQIVAEIGESDFVVLLDDFHYMPREIQSEVAKSLKEAVRLNVKIVTAAVTHRGDDIIRANPELRGRVRAIDLAYWSPHELRSIASAGFSRLNAQVSSDAVSKFVVESAGSPQLMQLLCLQACFVLNLREPHEGLTPAVLNLNPENLRRVLEQTSANTDYRSLVEVLDAGPRTRGTERKTYQFEDGTSGDVYRVVLRAVSADPPQLSFTYAKLLERTASVCSGDSPVGSSVTGTCLHMWKLADEKFPKEQTIDWDESKQVFDLPDPYFMFYLRWSGRLQSLT